METTSVHFLDRRRARAIAGLIALAALLAIAQVWHVANRMDSAGRPLAVDPAALGDPSVNAAFLECKVKRTGDVDRMLAEGLITAAQHAEMVDRAVAICAGQFPPGQAQ
jgi:hypothetical protein